MPVINIGFASNDLYIIVIHNSLKRMSVFLKLTFNKKDCSYCSLLKNGE